MLSGADVVDWYREDALAMMGRVVRDVRLLSPRLLFILPFQVGSAATAQIVMVVRRSRRHMCPGVQR